MLCSLISGNGTHRRACCVPLSSILAVELSLLSWIKVYLDFVCPQVFDLSNEVKRNLNETSVFQDADKGDLWKTLSRSIISSATARNTRCNDSSTAKLVNQSG